MIDKALMVDTMGRPLTQSLFLEVGYNEDALFTLKDDDHSHNGKTYPSIKKLYLSCDDPTEYEFATTYLLGWKHWQRLTDNKFLRKHIDEWREELEVKLRSRGVKQALLAAASGGFQASKWIADRGWDTRGAGRPTKAEKERELKIQTAITNEYEDDIFRLKQM